MPTGNWTTVRRCKICGILCILTCIISVTGEQTTAITWPPTAEGPTESDIISRIGVSFLRPTPSMSRGQPQLETQETQETASYNYSEASSIARFPEFHFSLHTLTRLSSMIAHLQAQAKRHVRKGSQKITILAAVLEVEGPDTICIKKGADAGKEVSILKVILGDEEGVVCKLTAWRETAETWGGAEVSAPGIKRGDVVLFENVLASWGTEPGSDWNAVPLTLTASPNLKSSLQICFRTMPYVSDDQRFRPDLRLGSSDAAFGKVALVVKWFEDMAGLPTG